MEVNFGATVEVNLLSYFVQNDSMVYTILYSVSKKDEPVTMHGDRAIDLCNNMKFEISVHKINLNSPLDKSSNKETDIILCIIHK